MTTIPCPHQLHAWTWKRQCGGCTEHDSDDKARWCDGEADGTVYRDSEGDPGVIGGMHSFLAVEDLELSCGCQLSADEEQQVTDALCERYAEGDDLADIDEADARREAGF